MFSNFLLILFFFLEDDIINAQLMFNGCTNSEFLYALHDEDDRNGRNNIVTTMINDTDDEDNIQPWQTRLPIGNVVFNLYPY